LGSIGDIKAIEPLKNALKDEGEFRENTVKDRAFTALEQISQRIHKRIPLEPR
jgi:HEAT repeat protein